jgi:hypothetical protein
VAAGGADAATITVTTTDDVVIAGEGRCSLRQAIATVNTAATTGACAPVGTGSPTIVLGAETYPLTIVPTGIDDNMSGDLNVTAPDVTITGAGGATTIDARTLGDRAVDIAAGAHVTISGLTIAGGHARDGQLGSAGVGSGTPQNGGMGGQGGDGGGIRNAGTLTLDHATITGNHAGNGGTGGSGATVIMLGDTATGGGAGGAGGQGGGIYSTGTLTITDSTISSNHAGDGGPGGSGGSNNMPGIAGAAGVGGVGHEDGGGIAIGGGTATISGSTIDGNTSGSGGPGGSGGAGSSFATAGGVGGSASWGGGLSAVTATVTITNSTIADNQSGDGGDGGIGGFGTGGNGGHGGDAGRGGAIRSANATVTLTNVTLAGNALGSPGAGGLASFTVGNANGTSGAAGVGGGLYVEGTPLVVANSIVASNTGGNCAAGSPITDGGHNLSFDDSSCPAGFVSGDPKLGVLGANGGPAPTLALGTGSAAIDQLPSTGAGCPQTDERGVARPNGPACDIGAYEFAPPTATTAAATNVKSTSATLNATVTPNAGTADVSFLYGVGGDYQSQTPDQIIGAVNPTAVSVTLTGLKPKTTYHYVVVIGAPDGNAVGADRTFTTAAAMPKPKPKRPKLTHLKLKPSKFRHKSRRGATVSYVDSEAAKTAFVVLRCVKFAKHSKACKLFVPAGSFQHKDRVGPNKVRLHSKLGHHYLLRGRYELKAIPTAGRLTGKTAKIRFTIT